MSKLKAKKPTEAKTRKPKMLVYAKAGVGKTWASLDFPNAYYIDTEGGATEKRYIDKLEKSGGVYLGVEDGSQDFNEIIEQVKALGTEKHQYKTLIIDSITKIFNLEIGHEMERLGDKDAFGASKKPAVQYMRKLVNWLEKIDMNVIIIAHEKPMWGKDSTGAQAQIGETFDAWDKLEYELDLVLQIKRIGESNRKAYIRKSRLESFPEFTNFNWGYDEFADKFGRETIEGEVKQLVLATKEQLEEFDKLKALIDTETQSKWLKAGSCDSFNEMETGQLQKCIDHLKKQLTTTKE